MLQLLSRLWKQKAPALGLRAGRRWPCHSIADRSFWETPMMWLTSLLRSVKRDPERGPGPARKSTHKRRAFLPRLEALEDRTVPVIYTVTNTADSGPGSLRDAITRA